jgi:tetratricopeptide (TPR) repeat protein
MSKHPMKRTVARPRRTLVALAIVAPAVVILGAGAVASSQATTPAEPGQAASPPSILKEAEDLERTGDVDKAIELYEQALKQDPSSYEAHLGLGSALDRKGEYTTARQHLQKALANAPDADAKRNANVTLANSFAFERNAAEGEPFYRAVFDAAVAEGNFIRAAADANALARLFLESGDADNAEKWYRTGYETSKKVTSPDPDQPPAVWEMRWHHAQSRVAARRGDQAAADEHAAAVKAAFDKDPELGNGMAEYHYLIGYNAVQGKQYDKAIEALSQANQEDVFIIMLLGQAYEGKGDQAKAKEHYERVLQMANHNLAGALATSVARERT